MAIRVEALRAHYERIHADRMRGLPIVNPALRVDTIGFREHAGDMVGVLLTPWFMNLVVLPADDAAYTQQGQLIDYTLPSGVLELTTHRDDGIGGYLSAVLYRDVMAIPDMNCAQVLAKEVLQRLFDAQAAPAETSRLRHVSRRAVLTGSDCG